MNAKAKNVDTNLVVIESMKAGPALDYLTGRALNIPDLILHQGRPVIAQPFEEGYPADLVSSDKQTMYIYYNPSVNAELGLEMISNIDNINIRQITKLDHGFDGKFMAQVYPDTNRTVDWIIHGKSYAPAFKGYVTGDSLLEAICKLVIVTRFGPIVEMDWGA